VARRSQVDVRALDRTTAMRVFDGVLRFAQTGTGDVNALQGDLAGVFRLRVGDYRMLFTLEDNAIRIFWREASESDVPLR
jgi:mRNA-degrading endonuclease RelE of RelBE toxin-antitoxin system